MCGQMLQVMLQQSWYPHASCQNLAGFVKFFVISAYLSSTTMHLLEMEDKYQTVPSWMIVPKPIEDDETIEIQ